MIDLGSALAIGLSGFLAGVAYANRGQRAALEESAAAGAVIVGARAFILTRLKSADGAGDDPDPAREPLPDNVVPITERRGGVA